MMQTLVRSADVHEIAAVKRLLDEAGLPSVDIDDQFPKAFVVAEHQGEIVGVAATEKYGKCGLLRSLAVSCPHRGRALGARLVGECLDRARAGGIRDVYLLTLDASSYFESFGFATLAREEVPSSIAKSSEFASICPETATVMVMRFGSAAD